MADHREDVEAAEATLHLFGDANPSALPRRSLSGVIAHFAGDPARGKTLIQEEIRLAKRYEVPIALGIALRRRALTESGQEALETLRESIAALQSSEASSNLAMPMRDWVDDCAGQISASSTAAPDDRTRPGAPLRPTSLEDELRDPALSGIESLTPTELRVAQLAARGHSNRDIAERIFVSRNTVAWHLRNVDRKLQIDSGERLTQLVEAWPVAVCIHEPRPTGGGWCNHKFANEYHGTTGPRREFTATPTSTAGRWTAPAGCREVTSELRKHRC